MAALTEGMHEGEFIGELAMGIGYHIKEVTLTSGENLVAGAVVGKVTTGGKYVAYDNTASDGSETAAGILYAAVDASGGDVTNARIVFRGPAIVNGNDLTWDAANDAAAITAGKADLDTLGIKVA
ncbi:head decoration protein [Novosphingobium sp. KN65.2]|uniref:head decoration protein n=1 Tax=Novosphingobium sp. KN65.2 TaxID=1478134 RepID=UPI0005E4A9E2|nr:head decoration protein [Novosphingobium sp. KN65.2]CDO34052.1 putative bacteriophage-related protein [Novosphingobium sp. KN65.2]